MNIDKNLNILNNWNEPNRYKEQIMNKSNTIKLKGKQGQYPYAKQTLQTSVSNVTNLYYKATGYKQKVAYEAQYDPFQIEFAD